MGASDGLSLVHQDQRDCPAVVRPPTGQDRPERRAVYCRHHREAQLRLDEQENVGMVE